VPGAGHVEGPIRPEVRGRPGGRVIFTHSDQAAGVTRVPRGAAEPRPLCRSSRGRGVRTSAWPSSGGNRSWLSCAARVVVRQVLASARVRSAGRRCCRSCRRWRRPLGSYQLLSGPQLRLASARTPRDGGRSCRSPTASASPTPPRSPTGTRPSRQPLPEKCPLRGTSRARSATGPGSRRSPCSTNVTRAPNHRRDLVKAGGVRDPERHPGSSGPERLPALPPGTGWRSSRRWSYQPRARHSGIEARSAPRVVSVPCPG
jgi:hypothetical protein